MTTDALNSLERAGIGVTMGVTYAGAPTVADDTILTAMEPYELQYMLDITSFFANREHFSIHPGKSSITVYHSPRSLNTDSTSEWFLNSQQISKTVEFTHLGINRSATDGVSSDAAVEARCTTARKVTYALMGTGLYGINGQTPSVSVHIHDIYIKPCITTNLEALILSEKNFEKLKVKVSDS